MAGSSPFWRARLARMLAYVPRHHTGAQGPRGETGAAGTPGAKGDKGDPGPTSAGVGGTNAGINIAAGSPILSATSVTLQQPGKVLVLVTGTFSVNCGAGNCDREIGASVDGTPVTELFGTIDGTASSSTETHIDSAGIVSVGAGTHSVQITSRITGTSVGSGYRGDVRVVAIALG